MDVAQVHDPPGVVEAGGDETPAAQHGAESLVEDVEVPHAIEERHDGGPRADGRGEATDRRSRS